MLFLNEIYDVSKAIKKLYEELYTLEIKGMKNSKQYQENLHLLIKGLNFETVLYNNIPRSPRQVAKFFAVLKKEPNTEIASRIKNRLTNILAEIEKQSKNSLPTAIQNLANPSASSVRNNPKAVQTAKYFDYCFEAALLNELCRYSSIKESFKRYKYIFATDVCEVEENLLRNNFSYNGHLSMDLDRYDRTLFDIFSTKKVKENIGILQDLDNLESLTSEDEFKVFKAISSIKVALSFMRKYSISMLKTTLKYEFKNTMLTSMLDDCFEGIADEKDKTMNLKI